ncbi:CubicO group peptidase (beta-lactamase class C family) [Caulobacter ginsengisoli]|uniref:CubicO group peptidase (Beta-lactamase class C family) n=1 Tax=Caulobacter ginsengisoli TaxID=400775 RepID=A0ABU0IRV1_9CAUL|nr:serine hydrolase domain-containing protein [Caulobacter ginsengisoli]MDQ0464740.1 CubicO group peptidase (beta-lactamase class C family) [Caulobacter ginsengisoli]
MTVHRRGMMFTASAASLVGFGCARASDAPEGSLQRVVDETGTPALAGAVVTREGLAFLEAAGVRRKGKPDPVTTDDKWHLGSNTKAMTAALYGRLVEQGKARWGATLASLFPDLKLDPAFATATIETLMSHRAGVSDGGLVNGDWLRAAHADTRSLTVQRAEFAARALTARPGGVPGQFAYANANFMIAGAAIERIAQRSWEETIKAELFDPLGMTSAGFGAPKGAQPWGHQYLGVMLNPLDPNGPSDNPAALGPAGTAHMSLTDYARFVRLFLTDGGKLLGPETIAHLTAPPTPGDQSYALGWITFAQRAWAQGPALAHEGSNTFWHAFAAVGPKRGLAVITAANADVGGGAKATQTLALQLIKRFA